MKAAFLIRCSTDKQDFSRQVEDLKNDAESLGFEFSEDLIFGEHITGKDDVTKRNRDSIKKLLVAIEEKKFDVLLISEVSRLSRDSLSGRYYVRQLCNAGIPTYFRDKRKWTMNPQTKEVDEGFIKELGTYFDGAAEYLRSMKTQVASGRRSSLRKNQLVVGHVPLGYKKMGGKDKQTRSTVIVDPDTEKIVVDMFNFYLQDGASMKSVSLQLTAKYHSFYSVSSIQQTISRELYCTGEYMVNMVDPDDRKKTPETFAVKLERPLVSREVFDAVTKKREKQRTARAPYPKQKVHLLSRLIKCPYCGHSFTPAIRSGEKKGEKYRLRNGMPTYTWRCMTRINNANECDSHVNLNNERMEEIVWSFIKRELIGYANFEKDNKDEKIYHAKEQIKQCQEDLISYEKSIAAADKKIERARSLLLLDVSDELLEEEKKRYAKTLKEQNDSKDYARAKIDELKEEISHLESRIAFLEAPINRDEFITQIENNEVEKRRLFVELIKSIVPYSVGYRIVVCEVDTVDGLYYILFNANQKGTSRAYYFSGVYGRWQSGNKKYEAYDEGDYFMLMHPSTFVRLDNEGNIAQDSVEDFIEKRILTDMNDISVVPSVEDSELDFDEQMSVDYNSMVLICKQNDWVLDPDYETPKSV